MGLEIGSHSSLVGEKDEKMNRLNNDRLCDGVRNERYHFPKNLWVNVAIKLISMISPTIASSAANITSGLCKFVSLLRLVKNQRPSKDMMLKTKASGGKSESPPKKW